MMKIDVSVIMPSLNVGKYIAESIKSVLAQSLKSIEVICVDAGSTDGTLEIIQKIASEDIRVKVINSNIKSYGYQVNIGINEAKGEYVGIVETDDYISEDMYEVLYTKAKEFDLDIVKSDYSAYWTQDNGKRMFIKRRMISDNAFYEKVLCPSDYYQIGTDDWYLWNGIYKRELIQKNKIRLSESKGAAFQDIGFIHRTNVAAERALYLRGDFYRYCIDREDSSSNLGVGLKYSQAEFSSLLESAKEGTEQILLYQRMCKSFYCSCENITSSKLNENGLRESFNWLFRAVKESVDMGIITSDNMYPSIWKMICDVISADNIDSYFDNRETTKSSLCKENRYIIFGCGQFGYEAYKYLRKNEYFVCSFMDNNEAFWGTLINNIPVIRPDEAKYMKKNCFIVANEKYCDDITNQLLRYGVEKNRIYNWVELL